jgi:DNA replication protein DnaC
VSAAGALAAAHCRTLRLPSVAQQAVLLAEEARRQGLGHLDYLVRLLELEVGDRAAKRAARLLRQAGFPLLKTLESFDFGRAPHLPEALLRELAGGRYIEQAECVILIGEPGTGKSHLATALGVAAAQAGRRVRFVTAGRLVNELIEARDARALGRAVARYAKVEILVIDELGYLPLSRTDAELLFQVLSERHERRPIIVTTNLPFGEWTAVFPDPRLCRAVLDRLTHRAHIIETGTHSARLQEALTKHKKQKKEQPQH